ncbi:MAG: L-serine ammonia-lyase, iron-sulfur-dependent subunit beta [Promethearchaeota archaeon]
MKYDSIFDVVGRIMVGPSSSHTAGACRIAYMAHKIWGGRPKKADIYLHGSFAETYRGHKSDVAIIGGLLGWKSDNERIPFSFQAAHEKGLKFTFHTTDLGPNYHPNSIKIVLTDGSKNLIVIGSSIGGGNILIKEINGMQAGFDGDLPTLIEVHRDKPGIIAKITGAIALFGMNVSEMHLTRNIRKKVAMSWIEFQNPIPEDLKKVLEKVPEIQQVRIINV